MIYNQDRNQMRQIYIDAWRKHLDKQPMQPLERMIIGVVLIHPEYHALLENPDKALEKDYSPDAGESNPFLHLGMHIAIQEQISINQPHGITDIYQTLCSKHGDSHYVEHSMMECLVNMLWESQHNNTLPDNEKYLECLRKLN